MAYIGKTPVIGNFQVCDAITVVDAQAAYTMQVGGVDVSPESANHMLVSLNGILQAPTSSFTVSGSTITFASALETGDVIDFIQILGNVLDLGVPSDNTVTTAKLADSSVTTAKLPDSSVTTAKLNDASVSLAKLTATGTKDATTFLRGDNTFNAPPNTGITMADNWRLTTSFTGDAEPIASNLERNDTAPALSYLGSQMTESSGVFTFPSTGIYYITFAASFQLNGDDRAPAVYIEATTDNSSYAISSERPTHIKQTSSNVTYASAVTDQLFDITDISNQKVRFRVAFVNAGTQTTGSTTRDFTSMRFIRLGDT
jgi:hypothetical protein